MVKTSGLVALLFLLWTAVPMSAQAADCWALADHVATQINDTWTGHLYSDGVSSVRGNAMMLQNP